MRDAVRWTSQCHRGMFVHAFAFKLAPEPAGSAPGPKWSYIVGIGRGRFPSAEMDYGGGDREKYDYFTREAAEQAALDFGRRVVDVMMDLQ
ncbi:hypothetical protein [Cupriavidus pauculus]|uniref:hypothetical protein n=1 Tax=Cupriavidus pauculus TaxID=82633 RepID=UPI0011AEFD88|nr:hypothetical protein [Cupriavidus pauculus]